MEFFTDASQMTTKFPQPKKGGLKVAKYMTRIEVQALLEISPRTLDYWLADGKFPQPFRLSPRKHVWKRSAVEAWVDGQAERQPANG